MRSERKEDWISIYTPEDERKIASPSYIKKLLGLDLSNVYNRIERLERKVDQLEAPGRQAQILELLQEHGKHNHVWISNRVMNYQWYDMVQLLDQGLIEESMSGSQIMYSARAK